MFCKEMHFTYIIYIGRVFRHNSQCEDQDLRQIPHSTCAYMVIT